MNYQICCIDDGQDNELYRLLRNAHLHLTLLSPSTSLLSVLERSDPDIILINYHLQTGSGPQVCQTIRERDQFSIIPIMIFSPQDSRDHILDSYRAGAEDFISASLPEEVILEKIFSLIRIRTMYEKLKEVDVLKDEFLSSVSHELRTPLTIIRENVSLVLDGVLGPIVSRQQVQLEHAINGIDRLTSIVNDLLDISQLKSGKMHLKRVQTNILSILKEIEQTFLVSIQERNLTMTLQVPTSLPPLYIDPKRIRQVLFNLLGNAIKFTPAGGAITLGATFADNRVTVEVSDTGPGIPAEHLKHIFDRFYRVDHGGSQPGTGIGLSICKQLIDAHGGKIWASSFPGEGAHFFFSLPLAEEIEEKATIMMLHELELAQKNQWSCAILTIELRGGDRSVTDPLAKRDGLDMLMMEARTIATRPTDLIVSYRGDRIFVVLNQTDRMGALSVQHRLENHIESLLHVNRGWQRPKFSLHLFPEEEGDAGVFYKQLIKGD